MNYPIPNATINSWYFYANTSFQLGDCIKPVNSKVVIVIDYTRLIPTITVNKYSFIIDRGGAPPLVIDDTKLTTDILSFSIARGVPGETYSIGIIAWYNDSSNVIQKRTDYLNLSVPDETDGCGCQLSVVGPNLGVFLNGKNVLFANDIPRYFVSNTPPSGANLLDVWYNPTTGKFQEYVSHGGDAFWQDLGGPQGSPGSTVAYAAALYYKATAAQIVFSTAVKDIFNNSYTLTNNNVFVYRNGTLLTPDDGSGIGGYTVDIAHSRITLLWPAGAGELISIIVPEPPAIVAPIPASSLFNEVLQVISLNTLSVLRHYADGNIGILFVNGQAFCKPNVIFTPGSNIVTWNSPTYSLSIYDTVFAFYSYSS